MAEAWGGVAGFPKGGGGTNQTDVKRWDQQRRRVQGDSWGAVTGTGVGQDLRHCFTV